MLHDATTGDYTLPPPQRAMTDEQMLRALKEKDRSKAKRAAPGDGSKRKKPKWPMTGHEHYLEQQRILKELQQEKLDIANGKPSRAASAMQDLMGGVKDRAQQMVDEHNRRVREL